MEVLNDGYELVDPKTLEPHPENPNVGDVETIRRSIEKNGWYGALVVQKSRRRILAGEHRWRVAVTDSEPTIPVLWVEVDDGKARQILAVDNRAAELAKRDPSRLLALLSSVDDLAAVLYDDSDLAELRRLTGQTTRDESAFLDGIARGEDGAPANGSDRGDWVPFTITLLIADRDKILAAVRAAKGGGAQTTADALVAIADAYLAAQA